MQTSTASVAFVNHIESASVPSAGRGRVWTGRVLSGLALVFLALDTTGKLLRIAPAIEGTTELGYPAHSVLTIGLIQLACVLLYAVPRTAALGAIMLTGYLRGAIATHVRVENPLFTHILFPIYVAALIWGGLYLRDPRLSLLLPFSGRRAR